ncbi:MAG: DUF2867 domain-containing protein [Candidatus Acidiferrales bacterium]
MKVAESEFLSTQAGCWTAKRAAEFSVLNVHALEIPAPPAIIFPMLSEPDLLMPGAHWKLLFGVRLAIGKLFGWDRGMESHRPQPFQVGNHYAFFRIEHVDEPHEVGMSMKNRLTYAVMAWLLCETPGGTMVFNVTCANFLGRQGKFYWRVIRPFHDGIIEDSLRALRERVQTE